MILPGAHMLMQVPIREMLKHQLCFITRFNISATLTRNLEEVRQQMTTLVFNQDPENAGGIPCQVMGGDLILKLSATHSR